LTLDKPGKLGPKLHPHAEGPPCPEYKGFDPASRPAPPKADDVFPALCEVTAMLSRTRGVLLVGSRNTTMQLLADMVQTNGSMAGDLAKTGGGQDGAQRNVRLHRRVSGQFGPLPPPPPGADTPPSPETSGPTPILAKDSNAKLREILDICLRDRCQAWVLNQVGKVHPAIFGWCRGRSRGAGNA